MTTPVPAPEAPAGATPAPHKRKLNVKGLIIKSVAVAALVAAVGGQFKYNYLHIGQQSLASLPAGSFAGVTSWGCAAQQFSGQSGAALAAFVAPPPSGQPSWVREAAKQRYVACVTEAAASRPNAAEIVRWAEDDLPPQIAGLFDLPGGTPPAKLSALQISNIGSRALTLIRDCTTAVIGQKQPQHTVALGNISPIGAGSLATNPKARGRFTPLVGKCIIQTEEATAQGAIPGGPDPITALIAGARVQEYAQQQLNLILERAGV